MNDIGQLRQSAIEKLNALSKDKLIGVLDFIDFVMLESPTHRQVLPAPDAFLECAGTWEFNPDELEEILQDIEQSRLMELKEQHDSLLD